MLPSIRLDTGSSALLVPYAGGFWRGSKIYGTSKDACAISDGDHGI